MDYFPVIGFGLFSLIKELARDFPALKERTLSISHFGVAQESGN